MVADTLNIKDVRQWLCWRIEERDGKPTKVPYGPRTGQRADSTVPETWGGYDEAVKAYEEHGYDGIGFVFTTEDDLCGVDLDKCVAPETGEIEEWAQEVIEELDSYTEISPSGTGVHVLVNATLPEGRNRKGRFEVYDRDRYFTVTGKHLAGTPQTVERRQEELGSVVRGVFGEESTNLKSLPDPEAGGSLDVLDELVNLKSERDQRLFKVYLVTLPLEHVGRPIFNASGAMGSGKTTIQRLIKRLLDPTAPETVRFDPRDFLQKAMHAYIVMLDNQNTIPEWASDTLCRLVTGEADSKRRLYTDDEDFIIELRRAALLNGINVPTDRGDVLDRSLVVELERIPDADRLTEEQIWELFAREHPRLLGVLFDTLAEAIALKPSLKLSRRPRLADWGEYAAAVYEVMGWGAETFLKDWDEVVRTQNQATLDGSPVAQAIIKLMDEHEECSGTSSKMHALLKEIAESQGVDVARDKAWPKSARWLWRRIKEVLPLLVAAGIEASRGRDESAKQITLRKIPTDDGSDGSGSESRTDKGETHANTAQDDGRSNGSGDANGMPDGSEKPPSNTASANTADTANRSGSSWESDPMRHYGRKGS
jgi:hypothetical protein